MNRFKQQGHSHDEPDTESNPKEKHSSGNGGGVFGFIDHLIRHHKIEAALWSLIGIFCFAYIEEYVKKSWMLYLVSGTICCTIMYYTHSFVRSLDEKNGPPPDQKKNPSEPVVPSQAPPLSPTTQASLTTVPPANPVTSPSISGPATTKLSDGRIIVNVTPEYLCGFFKQHMDIQAQKLVSQYIGKWMKLTGQSYNRKSWMVGG